MILRASLTMPVLAIVLAFPKVAVFGNAPPDFANDVLAVLQKNCIACHNVQKAEGGSIWKKFSLPQERWR